MISASFLAAKCLKKFTDSIRITNPEVVTGIVRDIYMDDFLGRADTMEVAIRLPDGLCEVKELRKWTSNNMNLIPDSLKGQNEDYTITICEIYNSITKILGLFWSSTTNTLN